MKGGRLHISDTSIQHLRGGLPRFWGTSCERIWDIHHTRSSRHHPCKSHNTNSDPTKAQQQRLLYYKNYIEEICFCCIKTTSSPLWMSSPAPCHSPRLPTNRKPSLVRFTLPSFDFRPRDCTFSFSSARNILRNSRSLIFVCYKTTSSM